MIGDDAERCAFFPPIVFLANGFLHRLDERPKKIVVEIVGFALHESGDALQTSAGIDRRFGQRNKLPVRLLVELHEDEIPELEESPRFGAFDESILRKFLAADFGPLALRAFGNLEVLGDIGEVDEYLAARTAGTGVGHLPEVVVRTKTVNSGAG